MNNDIKKYLNEVKIIIPLNSKEKQNFLFMLEDRIKETKLMTYQQIVDELGTPNELAASFIDDVDTDDLIKSIKKTNIIRKTAIVIILIILSCSLIIKDFLRFSIYLLFLFNNM